MKYNRMGKSGIKVSSLCMGTMTFGAGADAADSVKIYKAARDKGVNFFDCANLYAGGKSEEILGSLIKSHREEVVISSKAYYPVDSYAGNSSEIYGRGLNRTNVTREVEDSLKRLGRALEAPDDEAHLAAIKKEVRELAGAFPLYPELLA